MLEEAFRVAGQPVLWTPVLGNTTDLKNNNKYFPRALRNYLSKSGKQVPHTQIIYEEQRQYRKTKFKKTK